MTERLVSHLRYAALAVPNFEDGAHVLHEVLGPDRGERRRRPQLPGSRGLDRAVHPAPARRTTSASISSGSRSRIATTCTPSPRSSRSEDVQFVHEPQELTGFGGGYGFRVFDGDGRVLEFSTGYQTREARKIREREPIPVQALARRVQLRQPRPVGAVVHRPPRLLDLRLADAARRHRHDALHALQRHPPLGRDRDGSPPLAASPLVRDARHRGVDARLRQDPPLGRADDLGTGPAQRRRQHVRLLPRPGRQHDRVHDRAGRCSTRTPGARTA